MNKIMNKIQKKNPKKRAKLRKNSKEDYEDNTTIWDDLKIPDIRDILISLLITLNEVKAIELRQGFDSSFLKLEKNVNNSFTISEILKNKKITSVMLGFRYHFDRLIIYSKLETQKNWIFEFSLNCNLNSREDRTLLRFQLQQRIWKLLIEFFPNFSWTYYK